MRMLAAGLAGAFGLGAAVALPVTEPQWSSVLPGQSASTASTVTTPDATPTPSLFAPPSLPTTLPSPLTAPSTPTATAAPSGGGQARASVLVTTLPWTPEECRFAWGYLGADAQDDHDTAVRYQSQGNSSGATLYATYSAHWVTLEGIAAHLCGGPGPWSVSVSTVGDGIVWMLEARQSHLYDEQVHGANSWDAQWAGIYDRLISLYDLLPGGSTPASAG